MRIPEELLATFTTHYHRAPAIVVRAPGRVNLIGEHTDYNGGFVLPMAIERAVWIALEPTDDTTVELYSIQYAEARSFRIDTLQRGPMGWIEYVKGVAWELAEAGYSLRGFRGAMTGDVPLGAGLSSSAALECAVAKALDEVNGLALDPRQLALLAQRAENRWVGVQCGIMDQMISAAGQQDRAMMLDCRTLELTPVPIPRDTRVVILDTNTRRGLESSAYNQRRAQCESGARTLGVQHLRDATIDLLESHRHQLDTITLRRCRHVITECARVLQSVEALAAGRVAEFGQLMNASHASLRDDFEVSSRELDIMQATAVRQPGCLGARMTGAGFGGCAVALVQARQAATFAERVAEQYQRETTLSPAIYITRATPGAGRVEVPRAEQHSAIFSRMASVPQ